MKTPILRHATAFISSTFADMAAERDLMMYHVVPKVKKWAFERGILFDIVDLRWGINDKQAKDLHHTVKICLKKVQESDPLFLCFLGERYGWVPEKPYFNQSMFQCDIQKYTELSATELEIVQALDAAFYESPPKSCLFLLRDRMNLDGVPEKVREIYVEEAARDQVDRLRASIPESIPTIGYRAQLRAEGGTYALCELTSDGIPLEEVLFARICAMLTEQYRLEADSPTVHEDVLIRQQYHLRQIALLPRIESCHAQLRECLAQARENEFVYVGIPKDSALQSQVAQFLAERQQEGLRIIYRFMGIDSRLKTLPDLITSIAYELSGNADYLSDAVSALYFVKEELERTEEQILLAVVGLPLQMLDKCMSALVGLKFHKSLILVEVDDPAQMRYSLSHSDRSFEELARYLFEKHAKVLLGEQMERVLSFVNGDDALLQTLVTYLCTFATYDTLNKMLGELEGADKKTLTYRYVEQIIEIQNRHKPAGVMAKTLELLCHTPMPITEEDIVEVLWSEATAMGACVAREALCREVSFSLAFARDFIVEYDARFKIYDRTLTDYFMFREIPNARAQSEWIPTESALTLILRDDYVARLCSTEKPFDGADAQNLVELVKDYSDPAFKMHFHLGVMEEPQAFYKLACALGKRGLVDLTKTLAMQSMGMNVDSYYARAMRRVMQLEVDPIELAQGIMGEKRFSVSRKTHPDNPFLYYYGAALAINERDLASLEDFTAFLNAYASECVGAVPCHTLKLPACLRITPYNFTVYTVFDVQERGYESYFCYCDRGMVILCDALTGELKRAYAIPPCGEIISTFYQEKTVHIVSDQGIVIAVNVLSGRMELHRFVEEGNRVSAFSNNYHNGHQFAAVNGSAIEFYRAIVRRGSMRFKDDWTVQSVYGLPMQGEVPQKLAVTVCDANGKYSFLLIDLLQKKITFAYSFADNRITESLQNEGTGEIYLRTDLGLTFILRYDGGDEPEVDVDTDRYCFASASSLICENEDGVHWNGQLVTDRGGVLCGFASRKLIGFVTDDGRLCLIDNGY